MASILSRSQCVNWELHEGTFCIIGSLCGESVIQVASHGEGFWIYGYWMSTCYDKTSKPWGQDISLNENFWILNKISLKYVPLGVIDNMAALVQIKAWHRPGDKPLSEPMVVSLP